MTYIYIIEENAVSRIEITTGKIEPLNSGYTFTAIQTDYLGNVIFNGNDTAMNKIVGVSRTMNQPQRVKAVP